MELVKVEKNLYTCDFISIISIILVLNILCLTIIYIIYNEYNEYNINKYDYFYDNYIDNVSYEESDEIDDESDEIDDESDESDESDDSDDSNYTNDNIDDDNKYIKLLYNKDYIILLNGLDFMTVKQLKSRINKSDLYKLRDEFKINKINKDIYKILFLKKWRDKILNYIKINNDMPSKDMLLGNNYGIIRSVSEYYNNDNNFYEKLIKLLNEDF